MRDTLLRVRGSLMMALIMQIMLSTWSAAAPHEDLVPAASAPEFQVVRIEVSDRAEIEFLARWIDVWDVDPERGILEAAVDAEGFEVLRDFGFHYSIDEKRTEKYNRPFVRLKGQTGGIPGYPCYRTVEETLADGAALAAAYPGLVEWIDIGDSWEKVTPGGLAGYDLMVLRLTNTTNGIPSVDKPRLWVMGGVHARELVSPETVMRFGEHLITNYELDPDVNWLLDHHEIHLILITNPDGRMPKPGRGGERTPTRTTAARRRAIAAPTSTAITISGGAVAEDRAEASATHPTVDRHRRRNRRRRQSRTGSPRISLIGAKTI